MEIYHYFMLFIIYSFLGWLMEVICSFVQYKKFINRGFCMGPYCPIYGYGCLYMTLFLDKYLNDIVVLFVMSVFMCSILEYFTSLFMEKVFHARWWDYSNKMFNINGRICLETMVPFGFLGCLVMYVINPILIGFIMKIPYTILVITSIILFFIFFIDNIVSYGIVSNFKNTTRNIAKDSTEEITKMVRDTLANKSFLSRRLVEAFPKLNIGKLDIKFRKGRRYDK